jgi:predicted protein tyrosine phosphatase
MTNDKLVPFIQVCSLDAAREADVEAYDGIITIEDSDITNPFRVEGGSPPQRVLTFDDITGPIDNWVAPEEFHVRSALSFARQWDQPSLLIHCKAGMSRSPAMALAILADWLGEGCEAEAVRELIKVSRLCTPNKYMINLTDRVLGRNGRLVEACAVLDLN